MPKVLNLIGAKTRMEKKKKIIIFTKHNTEEPQLTVTIGTAEILQ